MNTFNPYDAENCDACGELDDSCDFHAGQANGEQVIADAVRAVLDDAELASLVLSIVAARKRFTAPGGEIR